MSKPRADGEIVRLSHIVNPIGRRRLKVSGDVEIVGVVPVVPALLLVEAAEAVSDRLGRISREVALRGIKLPCNSGQCSLGLDLDLGKGQAGDIQKLTGNFSRERQVSLNLVIRGHGQSGVICQASVSAH